MNRLRLTTGRLILILLVSICLPSGWPFPFTSIPRQPWSSASWTQLWAGKGANNNNKQEQNFLLDEFKTYQGEVIDPYEVLKISRTAELPEIKAAYRNLSRRFHPDSVRFRDIMPGHCNNLEDVRNHWERIKLSYEILSDPRTRKRYDRHEALADPGQAVRRAAVSAAMRGVTGLGQGLWGVGSFAFQQLSQKIQTANEEKSAVGSDPGQPEGPTMTESVPDVARQPEGPAMTESVPDVADIRPLPTSYETVSQSNYDLLNLHVGLSPQPALVEKEDSDNVSTDSQLEPRNIFQQAKLMAAYADQLTAMTNHD